MWRRIRFRWGVLILASVAIVTLCLVAKAGRFAQYPFVVRFGGQEAAVTSMIREMEDSLFGITKSSAYCSYVFKEPPTQVQMAMKSDLLAQGWDLKFEDEEFVVFDNSKGPELRSAFLRKLVAPTSEGFTCYAVVPREFTLVEKTVTNLMDQFGWTKPKSLKVSLAPDSYPNWRVSVIDGVPVVKIKWRNLGDGGLDVRLNYFYFHAFEAKESMPIRATMPPWGTKMLQLTFPRVAVKGDPGDFAQSQSWVFPGYHGSSADSELGRLDTTTYTLEKPAPNRRVLVIEPPRPGRTLELRKMTLSVNGKVVYSAAAVSRIGPGQRLTIPFSLGNRTAALIEWNYETRLLPNRHWLAISRRI